MRAKVTPGETVQTPFGKGVVQEVRNNGRVLVQVRGRGMLIEQHDIAPAGKPRRRRKDGPDDTVATTVYPTRQAQRVPVEVDLHGLTVDQALQRAEEAISDALIADLPELRLIHGRSGGRIKAALHPRLRALSCVRAVRLDPGNDGVTIVTL